MIDIYKNDFVYIDSLKKDDAGKCWILLKPENQDDEFSLEFSISESRYQTLKDLLDQDTKLKIKCNLCIESKIL